MEIGGFAESASFELDVPHEETPYNSPMQTKLAIAFLAALSTSAFAETNEEKLAKKLKAPFLKSVAWELDYDAALKTAKGGNKIIYAYFTRSYAP